MPDGANRYRTLDGLSQRGPPANIMAEQALLGAILSNNRAYENVSSYLLPDHFAEHANGRVYRAIARRIEAGRHVDAVTLKSEFENAGVLDEVGGTSYFATLLSSMVGIINASEYGREIYNDWLRRRLIEVGTETVNDAYCEIDPGHQLEVAEQRLFNITSGGSLDNGSVSIQDAVQRAITEGELARKGEGEVGLSTGFRSLDERIIGLRPGHLLIIAGRPAMGKAQPLDSRVLLADGKWRPVGEVRPGDRLASIDGAQSMVSGIFDRGEREVFKVTFSDGRSTEACGDHLWSVFYRDWPERRVLTTDKIREMLRRSRYKNRLSIQRFSGHFGHQSNLPLDPYVLGVLIGDGGLTNRTPVFTNPDHEIISELRSRIGVGAEIRKISGSDCCYSISSRTCADREMEARSNKRGYPYEVVSYPVTAALKAMGLMGCGSSEKFIPTEYLSASREVRLALLRGLMDTDGWAESSGSVRFSSSSRALSEGVRDLVRSLGGQCSIVTKQASYTCRGERRPALPAHMCYIRAEDGHTYFLLPRKSDRARRGHNANVSLNISSIEPSRTTETRCISVTHSSSLYLTDDYIVTHNSALSKNIAVNVACQGASADGVLTDGVPVAYFSLEETSADFGASVVSRLAEISVQEVLSGSWDITKKSGAILKAQKSAASARLEIFDQPRQSLRQIASNARRVKRRYGRLGLLVVDYLQLMPDPPGVREKRLAVGQNCYGLKDLAKELQCPVLLLSQLARRVEERTDKRPTMGDLRESGEIEDSADAIMLLYREEYYYRQTVPQSSDEDGLPSSDALTVKKWEDGLIRIAGKAEVIVPKVRRAEAGIVHLRFNGASSRFEEER